MTSCLVSRSISSMRSTSKRTALGLFPHRAGRFLRDHAELRLASQAWASISNQMRNRVSGDQMAAISGRL